MYLQERIIGNLLEGCPMSHFTYWQYIVPGLPSGWYLLLDVDPKDRQIYHSLPLLPHVWKNWDSDQVSKIPPDVKLWQWQILESSSSEFPTWSSKCQQCGNFFYAMFAMLVESESICLDWARLSRIESVALRQSWHQHQDPANGLTFWPAVQINWYETSSSPLSLHSLGPRGAGSPWASGGPEKSPTGIHVITFLRATDLLTELRWVCRQLFIYLLNCNICCCIWSHIYSIIFHRRYLISSMNCNSEN